MDEGNVQALERVIRAAFDWHGISGYEYGANLWMGMQAPANIAAHAVLSREARDTLLEALDAVPRAHQAEDIKAALAEEGNG